MILFRWLSVALTTLATTSALNAQTAPFSALGLTALFGQEASNEVKRCDAVLTFVAALLDPTNDSVQRVSAIIELAQDLSLTNTDELLQKLSSFNARSEAHFNGINMKALAGSSAPTDFVINAQFTPLGQINSQFQGIQAITGLIPSSTLTLTSGTKPVSKDCCAETGCCAAVSAAKTCPACQASQKVKEDVASLLTSLKQLQSQMVAMQSKQCPACTVSSTATTVKDDCCCVKAGQVQIPACPSGTCAAAQRTTVKPVISAGTFASGQACAWPQGTVTMTNGTTLIVPAPSVVTFLDEFQSFLNTAMPEHVFNANPVLSAPPVFFAGSAVPTPNGYSTPGQPFACPVQMPSPFNSPNMPASALTVSREAPAQPPVKHNVHLVTPHMEAHCERLTSAGNADHIVLEGNVQLLCNRNGQTIRIQGQRVVVHLADGTFTVESAQEMCVNANAPVSRVGYVVKPGAYLQTLPSSEVVCPPGPASSYPRD